MARFDNQTVLVTGGTSGIGLATAKRILAEGGTVIATGSRQQSLDKAAPELPGATLIRNDAGDTASPDALAAAVEAAGPLDAVFLNAGAGRFQPLPEITADEIDAQFNVMVRGPLLQAKALAPLIKDGGSIVLTTSVVNAMGLPDSAVYTGTKGAGRAIVRVLAREFAPRGIRVNAVSPGPISTGFFERTGMDEATANALGEFILSKVPLGRFGEADEVAAVAAFLLSREASFVSGSEYVVDGAMSAV